MVPSLSSLCTVMDDMAEEENREKPPVDRDVPFTGINSSGPTEDKKRSNSVNGGATGGNKRNIIKLSEFTPEQRLAMRAEKFKLPDNNHAKKMARAERFGLNKLPALRSNVINIGLLKKRAERFGGSVSKIMIELEKEERMNKRKERFGIVAPDKKSG